MIEHSMPSPFGPDTLDERSSKPIIRSMKGETTSVGTDDKDAEQRRLQAFVTRMSNSDEGALGELYDATIGRVYGFALRIVTNPAIAEEIASDVFMQAWRDARRYDGSRAKVITWLLMICRSRALDWMRARDPEISHDDPTALISAEDHPATAGPQDLLLALESGHALRNALEQLPAIQRQLIGLAFFRGLTHQEIAESARLPLGTVKSHIRHALDAMRAHLGEAAS